MSKFENLNDYAQSEATDIVEDRWEDEIEPYLKEGISLDVPEVFDDFIHEWVDSDFINVGLMEAAQILDQAEYVETDSGLWEGEDPQTAVITQAFFTYRNLLMDEVSAQIRGKLNKYQEDMEYDHEQLIDYIEDVENKMESVEDEDEKDRLEDILEERKEELSKLEDTVTAIVDSISSL